MAGSVLRNQKAGPVETEVMLNLAGQRLGRKGQETRARILSAAMHLLADVDGPPVTLTSIAREASMRLTNLYLYFPDFGELVLALLEQVMADADAAFMTRLRMRWPDESLGEASREFLYAHYRFWNQHARLLHLRNALSDTDPRLMQYRQQASTPMVQFLVQQMDGGDDPDFACTSLATVVLTGFERIATVVTNRGFYGNQGHLPDLSREELIDQLLTAEARLLELAIEDRRKAAKRQ